MVWRISDKMDALWWTVTSEGHWQLDRAIWEIVPRAPQALDRRQAVHRDRVAAARTGIRPGSVMAWSINGGPSQPPRSPLIVSQAPSGSWPTPQEPHRRPDGGTPYRQLSLWTLDPDEVAKLIPDKIIAGLC